MVLGTKLEQNGGAADAAAGIVLDGCSWAGVRCGRDRGPRCIDTRQKELQREYQGKLFWLVLRAYIDLVLLFLVWPRGMNYVTCAEEKRRVAKCTARVS